MKNWLLLAIVLSAAPLAAAPRRAAVKPTPHLAAGIVLSTYNFPIDKVPVRGFAVCAPGAILVPTMGGVATAGVNHWVIPPSQRRPSSVACDVHANMYVVYQGTDVTLVTFGPKGRQDKLLARLPPGEFEVASTADGFLWLWGKESRGEWRLFVLPRNGVLKPIWSGKIPISAAAIAGKNDLMAAMGSEIVLWRPSGNSLGLFDAQGPVDGLAVDPSGAVFISRPDGVAHLRSLRGQPTLVTSEVHGPLVSRPGALYILSRDTWAAVRIRRTGL